MIVIVDYGMGNIRSVENALKYLGFQYKVTSFPDDILKSEKIILPGVGSFSVAMENLNRMGLATALKKAVLEHKIPILGICLGMQLLAEHGYEGGFTDGLGFIKGEVKKLEQKESINNEINEDIRFPHVGFNTVEIIPNKKLFNGMKKEADFYFVHSYALFCQYEKDASSWVNYGQRFVSSVEKGNIFGTQFHPEKSQTNGLLVLNNFLRI